MSARLIPRPSALTIYPHLGAIENAVLRAATPGEAMLLDGLCTFEQLYERLAAPRGSRYAGPLQALLLVRHLLLREKGALGGAAEDAHFVFRVSSALMELREAGVTAQHLLGCDLPEPATDLANLLGRYERALEQGRLYDDADRQREAVLAAAAGSSSALLGITKITVEGLDSLFGSRLDLLKAFAATGRRVEIRLAYDAERRSAFAWPEASLHLLEAAAAAARGIEVRLDDRVGEGPLAELRRAQWTNRCVKGAPVRVLRVSGPREHALAAAREVARWVALGVPRDAIAVVVAPGSELSPLVVHELDRLGIAARERSGRSLSESAAARALLLALELPLLGYPREELIELWLAVGSSIATPQGPLEKERVASLLRRAGVRSQRLAPYRQVLDAWGRSLGSHRPSADVERQKARLVADTVESLMSELERWPHEGRLEGQLAATLEWFEARLKAMPAPSWRVPSLDLDGLAPLAGVAALSHEAALALEELLGSLHQASTGVVAKDPLSRRGLLDLVRHAMAQTFVPVASERAFAVNVVTPAALVESHYSRVVAVGVDAETFPRAYVPDPVLTEEARASINARLGPRLLQHAPGSGREALSAEARDCWLWMELVASCRDELVLTCTRPRERGECTESEFVLELVRSAGEEVVREFVPPYASRESVHLRDGLARWAYTQAPSAGRLFEVSSAPGGLEETLRARQRDDLAHLVVCHTRERRHRAGQPARLLLAGECQALADKVLGQVQTTSRVDALGMCSFRFFAGAVLGLGRDDLPGLGIDARGEGTVAHAALEAVYRSFMRNGGLSALRADPDALRAKARAAFEAARSAILGETLVHPLLEEAVLAHAWRAVETRLAWDLAAEQPSEPLALEYRFDDRPRGEAPLLSLSRPGSDASLRVRGSIDRVDRVGSRLTVIDYKRSLTKRSPGRHFQLPIYLAVAIRDFGGPMTEVAAEWFDLRQGKSKPGIEAGLSKEAFAESLDHDLWQRFDRLLAGDTSPDPDSADLCDRCDFRPLCRYVPSPAEAESEETEA